MEQELLHLVEGARNGDKAAFEALCRAKARDVLYICTLNMGNIHDGEDAAQEVFFKLQKHISTLKNPGAFVAWSNRIIANTCIQMLRKRNARKDNLQLDEKAEGIEEIQMEFLPQEFAEEAEQRQVVLDALQALKYKNRQVLVLFYYEGLSTKEIAQALDITPKAAESALYHARGALKKQIGKRTGYLLDNEYDQTKTLGGALVLSRILQADALQSIGQQHVEQIAVLGAAGVAAAAVSTTISAGAGAATAAVVPGWAILAAAAVTTAVAITIGASSASVSPPVANGAASPPATVQQAMRETTADEADIQEANEPLLAPSPGAGATPVPPDERSGTGPGGVAASTAETTSRPTGQATTSPGAAVAPAETNGPAQEGHPQPSAVMEGLLVLLDNAGKPVEPSLWLREDTHLTCKLPGGEATLVVGADGSFTLETLPYTTLVVQPPNGLELARPESTYTLTPGKVCEIYLRDSVAPTGLITLYNNAGAPTESQVDPAIARLEVFEETTATARWQLRTTEGLPQAEGEGLEAVLSSLTPGSYTLYFTITDAAGNTTTVKRNFAVVV